MKFQLIYTIPTFQNTTGVTWTLERRKAIADITGRYNKVVIEDNQNIFQKILKKIQEIF